MTKILLVEDDKSLREIYGVRLLAEGYDIVSAGDGEEALAMAIKERPQLIVSDVMMPKISGFDMLDILRSTTETKEIKVIMMTALSSEDQRARGEQLGADRYLVKSQVGIEDVVRTVHEVLGDAPVAQSSFAQPSAPAAQPATQAPAPAQPPAAPPQAPAATPAAAPAVAPSQPAQVAVPTTPAPTAVATPAGAPPTPPAVTPSAPTGELPQPTAPFSSPRPATLGERVIQPMDTADAPGDDMAERIAAELASAGVPTLAPETPAPATAAPQTPPQPPAAS